MEEIMELKEIESLVVAPAIIHDQTLSVRG